MKLINDIYSHLSSAIHYFMNGLSNLASSFVKRINDIGTQAISCVGSWFNYGSPSPSGKLDDFDFSKPEGNPNPSLEVMKNPMHIRANPELTPEEKSRINSIFDEQLKPTGQAILIIEEIPKDPPDQ